MIGIVDYGMGNLLSVANAVEWIGSKPKLCSAPKDLEDCERIILPGVGAFKDCALNLRQKGFVDALHREVMEKGKPILGICLGMQVMARRSFEGGEHEGLGWFEADVVRLTPSNSSLRVPQIGWNEVSLEKKESAFFKGLPCPVDLYFVHSFAMRCDRAEDVVAVCDYGGKVTAAVSRDNIFATQFHPEKSQDHGLSILSNFLHWKI